MLLFRFEFKFGFEIVDGFRVLNNVFNEPARNSEETSDAMYEPHDLN